MPGAHTQSKPSRANQGPRGSKAWLVAITIGVVAVVAVGIGALSLRGGANKPAAAATASGSDVGNATTTAHFTVVALTPAAGESQVPSDATISVQLSDPISAHSATPTLSPALAGSWRIVSPDTFEFVASGPLVPSSTETLTVPGGSGGVTSTAGKTLALSTTAQFSVADGSVLRLEQLLAQLGYLPLNFTPAGPLAAPQEAAQAQQGSFSWRNTEPSSLTSLWTVGTTNQIVKGAVMAFESQHGLKTDGVAGPAVWTDLLSDAATGTMDPNPYNYVYVSQSLPESATVYSNGVAVYSTVANTGATGAATEPGTFPVYLRYVSTTMSGTNPNGTKYVDPDIPWVSYFNGGDALHGYVRASYGFPQSDGCVEMPPAHAAVVYPLTPIGTLVTVSA